MNQFLEYFLGEFNNRRQTFQHPTRYSYIRILHRKISDDLIYGEQAYAFRNTNPYRQFVLEPILEGNSIRMINYSIDNPSKFIKGKNLDQLSRKNLILKTGCDTIFVEDNGVYYGELKGCDCAVKWNGKNTYLQNKVELGKNYYYVLDKGICCNTHKQIWGSRYGYFKFVRQ